MEPGGWMLAASWLVALAAAFPLRARLSATAVLILLVAAGAGLGWGGMLLRPSPSTGEWAVAVVALAILVPAHVRIVLGPFGRRGARSPEPAAEPDDDPEIP